MREIERPRVSPNQGVHCHDFEVTWTQPEPLTRFFRRSILTGVMHFWDLPVSGQQLFEWKHKRVEVQTAMAHLNAEQREFVLTGITPEEWKEKLG